MCSDTATSATAPPARTEDQTRTRLLQAAEQILVEDGASGVSVRRLVAVARCNLSLVSYHFNGLQGLLITLAWDNLKRITSARTRLLAEVSPTAPLPVQLRGVLEAYALPMWQPTYHAGLPSAAGLMAQLLPLLPRTEHQHLTQHVSESIEETCAKLGPLLPHLSEAIILMRLRLLLGAVQYAEPGHWTEDLFTPARPRAAVPDALLEQVLRFAEGALQAPA